MGDDGTMKPHTNHPQPQPVHNMEDLQSELERVSSAMMSAAPPAVPVTRVDSNDDGDGPSTADDPSSFITLMPPTSARPIVIPPPNFPVEAGELTVSPSTVRISSDEQSGMAGLGEMTLRIGVPAAINGLNTSVIVERPPEPPAKFMTDEVPEPAVESPIAEEEEVIVEEASGEDPNSSGRAERYTCNDCGKTFIYKMAWINHKLTHAGVAPFECKKCGKTFAYNSSVYNHMKIPGRCKGYRKTRVRASKEAPVDRTNEVEVESSEEEPVGSPEQDHEKRQEKRGPKSKQTVAATATAVEPEKRASSSKSPPVPKVEVADDVEIVDEIVAVPRKRGRPPKHPRPATSATPTSSVSTPKPVKPGSARKASAEKVSPPVEMRRESEMHSSRSRRRIQPPMWMRNMEMDYEIPVTSGIFLGDNSRPLSTGANWREVNSITNEKRRKSTGDSASDDEYPALQREDTDNEAVACNGSVSTDEATGKNTSGTVENGDASENGALEQSGSGALRSSNGRFSSASATASAVTAVNSSEEIRVPKKRGRKPKKVVDEAQNAEQSDVAPDTPSNDKSVSKQTNTISPAAGQESVSSPMKRNLRGLPHRSEAVAETPATPAEVPKSPIPKKKLKIEAEVEEERDVVLPAEEDEGEEQLEQVEEMEVDEEEEEVEEEEEDEEEDDDEGEQVEEDEGIEDEDEEEEQSQEQESVIGVQVEEDKGNSNSGMEPMNEEEDEVYQEEEEEEDTDVVEGSDNEQPPPPPQENAEQADPVVPVIQAAAGSSTANNAPVPAGEFDLKTAAIAFLNKKISNRNMHRIRRELMELTDHGDYFQLTQWAPLAAGFLQAMLLRNFSKE